MIVKKNVGKYVFLSKKSNDLAQSLVSMTSSPFFTVAVYSFHQEDGYKRDCYLLSKERDYCRRYMAKANGYNIYVELKGVLTGEADADVVSAKVLGRVLQEMAEFAANVILKDAPKKFDFKTRPEDWQPLDNWGATKSSFTPIL